MKLFSRLNTAFLGLRTSAAAAVAVLGMTCLLVTGCTPDQTQQVKTVVAQIGAEIPKALPLVQAGTSIAEGILPAYAPIVAAVSGTVQAGLVQLAALCNTYASSPSDTVWASIQATVTRLVNSGASGLLDAAKITDPASRQKATEYLGLLQTVLLVIDGFVQSAQSKAQVKATAALRPVKLWQIKPYLDQTRVETATYDAKVAEMQTVEAEIARHRSAEKLEGEERAREEAADAARRSGRPPLPNPGASHNQGSEERELSAEEIEQRNKQEKRSFGHYLKTRDDSQLRAMSSGTGSQGGYTIPTLTQPIITQAELAFGGVIPFLDAMPTTTGEQINWPLGNDTSNMGSEIAENVAASEQDAVLGTVPLTTSIFTTGMVQIPRTLLRDSVVDIADYIVKLLAVRRARRLAYSVINGTNTSNAFTSLLNSVTLGATTASPTAIGLPDVSELFGAVDPGYALNGNFVMHRSSRIYLACLRNGLGAPIFPLDQDGMLTKIFGKNIVDDQGMPVVAANAPAAGQKLVLFGDLKSYIYRPVGTMEVMRLEERYAEFNQVGFVGFYSAGGQYVDAGTHPIQYLAQHA